MKEYLKSFWSQIKNLAGWARTNYRVTSSYGMSKFAVIVIIASSIVLSVSIYGLTQQRVVNKLIQEYQNANIVCDFVRKNSQFDSQPCEVAAMGSAGSQLDKGNYLLTKEMLFEMFKAANIISPNDVRDVDDFEPSRYPAEIALRDIIVSSPIATKTDQKTLEVLLSLITDVAKGAGGEESAQAANCQSYYMGAALSGAVRSEWGFFKPETYQQYVYKKYKKEAGTIAVGGNTQEAENAVWNPATFDCSKEENTLSWLDLGLSDQASDHQILHVMLSAKDAVVKTDRTGLKIEHQKYKDLSKSPKNQRAFETALMKLLTYYISQTHSSPKVEGLRERLTLLRGPEQFSMLLVTILILLVMFNRWWHRVRDRRLINSLHASLRDAEDKSTKATFSKTLRDNLESLKGTSLLRLIITFREQSHVTHVKELVSDKLKKKTNSLDDVRSAIRLHDDKIFSTRWLIRWGAITVPAIGFIGTVRGIMGSLSGADAIVWANNQAERAGAISSLSGELGLAFGTTYIALVLGILISILNESQSSAESQNTHLLESWAVAALDPEMRGLLIPDNAHVADGTADPAEISDGTSDSSS